MVSVAAVVSVAWCKCGSSGKCVMVQVWQQWQVCHGASVAAVASVSW